MHLAPPCYLCNFNCGADPKSQDTADIIWAACSQPCVLSSRNNAQFCNVAPLLARPAHTFGWRLAPIQFDIPSEPSPCCWHPLFWSSYHLMPFHLPTVHQICLIFYTLHTAHKSKHWKLSFCNKSTHTHISGLCMDVYLGWRYQN